MFRLTVKFLFLIFGLTVSVYAQYTPPPASAGQLTGIDFKKATPLDEDYRKAFDECDKKNTFFGKKLPNKSKCSTDPNMLKALLKFPDGTIFFDSKMSLDLDGSFRGCGCVKKGATDQCRTSYLWTKGVPTEKEYNKEENKCVFYERQTFVDSDAIPYMVIPSGTKFKDMTTLVAGDLGVVIYRDKTIPVFVADTGPFFRIGEGSMALFDAVGVKRCNRRDAKGHCIDPIDASIENNVLFFVFPKSAIKDLKRNTALEDIKKAALKRFEDLKKSL